MWTLSNRIESRGGKHLGDVKTVTYFDYHIFCRTMNVSKAIALSFIIYMTSKTCGSTLRKTDQNDTSGKTYPSAAKLDDITKDITYQGKELPNMVPQWRKNITSVTVPRNTFDTRLLPRGTEFQGKSIVVHSNHKKLQLPFSEKIVREDDKRFRDTVANTVALADDILGPKPHSDTHSAAEERKRHTIRKVDIPLPFSILETRNESNSYNHLKKLRHNNHRRRFKHLPPLA